MFATGVASDYPKEFCTIQTIEIKCLLPAEDVDSLRNQGRNALTLMPLASCSIGLSFCECI